LAAAIKFTETWVTDWRGVSTGAALEAARRVAKMVEMIETFILGFEKDLILLKMKNWRKGCFSLFFLIERETLNSLD
jgi:hypothetical protein